MSTTFHKPIHLYETGRIKLFPHRPLSSFLHPPSSPHTPITPEKLLSLIKSSQWPFIKHLSPNFNPSLISATLILLRPFPDLVINFIDNIHHTVISTECYCLATSVASRHTSPKHALQLIKKLIGSQTVTPQDIFYGLVSARERLSISSSISFDLLIRAFCEIGQGYEAVECFNMMKKKEILPDSKTLNCMLSLFIRLNWAHGPLLAEMFRSDIIMSVFTFNIIINGLCKQGKLKKAMKFVEYMVDSLKFEPNVVTFNSVIHGYCLKRDFVGVNKVLETMKEKGIKPDSYTYVYMINLMCYSGKVEEASGLLSMMEESGLVPMAVIYNSLINGYCNAGELERAFSFRAEMVKKGIVPNVWTYNSLIRTLLLNGRVAEADDLVRKMEIEGVFPDEITYNILINGSCQAGDVTKAFSLHDEMLRKGIALTRVTYTSLICMLGKRKMMEEADDLMKDMLEKGILPDLVMFNALIDGHCANGKIKNALLLLKEMERMKVKPNEVTYNIIMQGYCKTGKVKEASSLLDVMKRSGVRPDFVSFNRLICRYSMNGDIKNALRVLDEMPYIGFEATRLTYNTLIQGSCTNGGHFVEEVLKEMVSRGITPNGGTYMSLMKGIMDYGEEVPGRTIKISHSYPRRTPFSINIFSHKIKCSSSTFLVALCSKSATSRSVSVPIVNCSSRNNGCIPKLEPFSRSKIDRAVKDPPLIQKSENQIADYCVTVDGDDSYSYWQAYFELKDLEKEAPKEEVERLIIEAGGIKSLIGCIHGVSSIHKSKKEHGDSLMPLKIENVRASSTCPIPDGLPKTREELEEEEKARMPDSLFTRLLRAKGKHPAWYSPAPEHETD